MVEEKIKAGQRLLSEFRDAFGRVTLYPDSRSNALIGHFDSENLNLWTGEASVLLKLNGLVIPEHKELADTGFAMDTVEPGLISRQPFPYWLDNNHHIVSWDEFNGLMYHAIVYGDQDTPREVIDYGRRHFYSYVDGFEGVPLKKRVALFLSGLRQPRDFFFYKIAAGIKPNLFEALWAATSHILSSRKPADITSGKMMGWFKMKALDIAGYEGKIWGFAKKRFDKNLKKMYNGDDYIEKMARIYFKETEPEHPFHALFKGL